MIVIVFDKYIMDRRIDWQTSILKESGFSAGKNSILLLKWFSYSYSTVRISKTEAKNKIGNGVSAEINLTAQTDLSDFLALRAVLSLFKLYIKYISKHFQQVSCKIQRNLKKKSN